MGAQALVSCIAERSWRRLFLGVCGLAVFAYLLVTFPDTFFRVVLWASFGTQ